MEFSHTKTADRISLGLHLSLGYFGVESPIVGISKEGASASCERHGVFWNGGVAPKPLGRFTLHGNGVSPLSGGSSALPANLCPIHCGGAASHSRHRTTILHNESADCKRFWGNWSPTSGTPPKRRFGGTL